MPDVPDDLVLGRIEDPVEGDGQLDHPETGGKMAAVGGAGGDDLIAELGGQKRQVFRSESLLRSAGESMRVQEFLTSRFPVDDIAGDLPQGLGLFVEALQRLEGHIHQFGGPSSSIRPDRPQQDRSPFPVPASLPASLPISSVVPSISRISSAIWKASPTASP